MSLSPNVTANIRLLRRDLGAIRERLEAIERVFGDYRKAVSAAEERERNKEQRPTEFRGEVRLPEAEEQKRSAEQKSQHATQKWIARGTWAATLAAVIYAGIAARQLREMRRATVAATTSAYAAMRGAQIAQEALESVQRAFVTFSPAAKIGVTVSGNKVTAWSARVPMRNNGSTNTVNLRSSISFYYSRNRIPSDFSFPDTGEVLRGMIGTKDEIELRSKDLPISDIQAIQNGTGHVYVYGWATYRDIFPTTKPHVTLFCYELLMNTIKADLTNPSYNLAETFVLCSTHNCSDETCQSEPLPRGFSLQ